MSRSRGHRTRCRCRACGNASDVNGRPALSWGDLRVLADIQEWHTLYNCTICEPQGLSGVGQGLDVSHAIGTRDSDSVSSATTRV